MVRSIVLFSPFPRGERQRKTNDFHYLIIGEEVYWKTSPLTPLDASNSLRVGKFAIMVIGKIKTWTPVAIPQKALMPSTGGRERVASGKEMAWGLERKLLGKKYQGGFPTVCGLQL